MTTLILRQLRDRRTALIAYTLSSVLLLWMYVGMFPSISAQAEKLNDVIAAYPEALLKAFNVTEMNFTRIENFISMEHYSLLWPFMAFFFAASLAGSSLAGEIGAGTIDHVLALPVSRRRLFLARFLAGAIALALFTGISLFAIIPLAQLHNIEVQVAHHATFAVLAYLCELAVFSIALCLSAIFSEKSRVYAVVGGVLVAMYALDLFASLRENLVDLQYASFFYYYDYQAALTRGVLHAGSVWVFVGTIIVATSVGAYWFNRRDVSA